MFSSKLVDWINLKCSFKSKEEEKKFGLEMNRKYFNSNQDTNQWTTALGEGIVEYLLKKQDNNVKKQVKLKEGKSSKIDCETSFCYVEVKTRNYKTNGTAGEKIFYALKYIEYAKIKPIIIVLVGNQEVEADKKYKLFDLTNKLMVSYRNFCSTIGKGIFYLRCSELYKNRKNKDWLKTWIKEQKKKFREK